MKLEENYILFCQFFLKNKALSSISRSNEGFPKINL